MTERLYYTDAYTIRFQANILERAQHQKQLAVVLDRTYFYPTSGGQPCDEGQIAGTPVTDVIIRESDQAVLHIMAGEVWSGNPVSAEIAWPRRFDHMQQHTGQHILSQAFIRAAAAETVGFHLGQEYSTIDLHRSDLTGSQVEQAETIANQIIWENRPVTARFVSQEEAGNLPLRKIPPVNSHQLRLIDIDSFDLTACGGTHVTRTGEVGMIKIVKLERRNQELRVTFQCGRRALLDYRQKNRIVNKLAADLTVGYWELEEAVARLRDENKSSRTLLKRQQAELLLAEADRLLRQARRQDNVTIVTQAFAADRDPGHVRQLGNLLVQNAGVVALLGVAGGSARLVFCRAGDAPGEMNQLIKAALQVLGSTAGGGTPAFAQGGGPGADVERVQAALQRAERLLLAQLLS